MYEMLNMIAIIGVLVAISIPIFTAQLKKARIATNQANARAAYAAATADYLTDDTHRGGTYTTSDGKFVGATKAPETTITDTNIADWATNVPEGADTTTYTSWTVALDDSGAVTGYGHN